MKWAASVLLSVVLIGVMSEPVPAVELSSFCQTQVPGKFIIEAQEGNWNCGMAPIYHEKGTLHVFNSTIRCFKHVLFCQYNGNSRLRGGFLFGEESFFH